jgi:ribonuclease III
MTKLLYLLKRFGEDKDQKQFRAAIKSILGAQPTNLALYELAMLHSSAGSLKQNQGEMLRESNERLEYLGDAILGAVVAHYLFNRYPYKDEGFLTEIRSRIVSRASLNDLAVKLGINQLVNHDVSRNRRVAYAYKSMYGDAMEAFVGAVYLDKGYDFCHHFIVKRLLLTYLDLDTIISTTQNYKSKLIEWSQKNSKHLNFDTDKELSDDKVWQFRCRVLIQEECIAEGNGANKKNAEQDAARRACEILEIE